MKITISGFAAVVAVAAAFQSAFAASSTPMGFTDNLDEALARAKASGRYVLVDFSGSDWCGWCKKLDAEVFSKAEFLDTATNAYELVFIDSPSDQTLLSERAKAENPKLVDKYHIGGFPTVLLMDGDGNVVAQTGYRKGGPEKYLKHVKKELKLAPQIAEWVTPVDKAVETIMEDVNRAAKAAIADIRKTLPKGSRPTPDDIKKLDAVMAPVIAEALPKLEALAAAEKAKVVPEKGVAKSVRKRRAEILEQLDGLIVNFKSKTAAAEQQEAPAVPEQVEASAAPAEQPAPEPAVEAPAAPESTAVPEAPAGPESPAVPADAE